GVDCGPMRARLPLYVLLASALTFIASLYLPWQEVARNALLGQNGVTGVLTLGGGNSVDGWGIEVGGAASLAALLLVGLGAAALVRPDMADDRLPLVAALTLSFLAIATLVALRADQRLIQEGTHVGGASRFATHTARISGSAPPR